MSKCLPCGRQACAGTPLTSRTSLDRHPGVPRKGSVPAYGVGLHSPICSEVEVLSSLSLPLPEPRAQVAARFAFACLVVPLGILLPPVAPNPCLHPRRLLPLPLLGQSSVSRCSAERRGDALAPVPGVVASRRGAEFITPIPKPKKQKAAKTQQQFVLDEGMGLSTQDQQYDVTAMVNEIRGQVDQWRSLRNPNDWCVTPETARLLQHWRHHDFSNLRPFFCQVEAVETAIWLTEVAPKAGQVGRRLLDRLANANNDANLELAQRPALGGRQDRVLPTRRQLVQPHDPGRQPAGDGLARRARGAARQGAVHLRRPALRHQVQLPVVDH